MLSRVVNMEADLLFKSQNFNQRIFSLTHMLDSLHKQTCVRALLGHQAYHYRLVHSITYLKSVQLRVKRP